jgi:hypothetical protein
MTTPKYIEASRQAAREAQVSDRNPFGRIGRTCSALEQRCPDHVPVKRWVQAVKDAKCFLAVWGQQAESLGWCRPIRPARDTIQAASVLSAAIEIRRDGLDLAARRPPGRGAHGLHRRHREPHRGPSPSIASTTSQRSGRWAIRWKTSAMMATCGWMATRHRSKKF